MKKSTLITTIAMIVVVVVALSTATYAWFTSSSTAVATTSFSTTAAGDWSMIIGSVSGTTLTFNTSAVDSAPLTNTPIQSGLWAPTAEISTTIASTAASTSLANKAGFVQGTKDGDNANVTALLTESFNSSANPAAQGNGLVAPFAMRIINTSGISKQLQLNITLNAGQSTTNNSLYGAAAVRFYIYEITNTGANGTSATYTSGYYYSVKGSTGFTGAETLDSITTIQYDTGETADATYAAAHDGVSEGDPIYADRKMTKSAAVTKTAPATNLADYTAANIEQAFPAAQYDDDELGITAGDHVLTYAIPMQTYAVGGYSNIIIYAWIDGWVADNSAGRATFGVNFGFTSVGAGE